MKNENIFGERLKQLRFSRDMTQIDLADVLSVTKSTICNYERGPNVPSIEILLAIYSYFEVSLDYLFGLDQNTKACGKENYIISLPLNVTKEQYIFIRNFINEFLKYDNNNKTSL